MKNKAYSLACSYALTIAVFGIGGCAVEEPQDPGNEVTPGEVTEAFDDDLAATLAASKRDLVETPPFTAHHASCGTTGPNIDNLRVNDAASGGTANQRSGSSTSCVALGALQPTDDALYHCFTVGNDGFTWTYLKNIRTGVRGWVRDDLLRDGGSFDWCGF